VEMPNRAAEASAARTAVRFIVFVVNYTSYDCGESG